MLFIHLVALDLLLYAVPCLLASGVESAKLNETRKTVIYALETPCTVYLVPSCHHRLLASLFTNISLVHSVKALQRPF